MTKTQPLLPTPPPKPAPAAAVRSAPGMAPAGPLPTPGTVSAVTPVKNEPGLLEAVDNIPVPLAAIICGIAAVTFLIQIWNYFAA